MPGRRHTRAWPPPQTTRQKQCLQRWMTMPLGGMRHVCHAPSPHKQHHTCSKLCFGFCLGLAALQRHDRRDVIGCINDGLVPCLQHRRALFARACSPLREAGRRFGDGSACLCGTHVCDSGYHVPSSGVAHVKRGAVAGGGPVAPNKALSLQQCLVGHQLEQVVAQGCVGGLGLRGHWGGSKEDVGSLDWLKCGG